MVGAGDGGSVRHNILVIMSDEQRYDTLGCTGNDAARTPHLDALAERGAVLDRCYTPYPLCCPARASLWTGFAPHNHHVLGNWRYLRPDLRDGGLIEAFASAGYHTFYSGKWHMPGTTPQRIGFADQSAIPGIMNRRDRGRYIPEYRAYAESMGYELVRGESENLTATDVAKLKRPGHAPCGTAEIALHHFIEPWQTEQFLATLERAPDDKPFFGVVSYSAPHFPLIVPSPYDRLIDPDRLELPGNFRASVDGKPASVVNEPRHRLPYVDLPEAEWRKLIAHYYGLCSLVDAQVGTIMDALDRNGSLENTIIVYLSDHGDMMGSHGMFMKGHPFHYEETNRIPAIIAHPDDRHGRRVGELTTLMDIVPTLAEFVGVDIEKTDGFSYASALTGGAPAGHRDHVISETVAYDGTESGDGSYRDPASFNLETDDFSACIRTGSWTYVFHLHDHDELYDLEDDPDEMHNLIAPDRAEAHAHAAAARLATALRDDIAGGCPAIGRHVRHGVPPSRTKETKPGPCS